MRRPLTKTKLISRISCWLILLIWSWVSFLAPVQATDELIFDLPQTVAQGQKFELKIRLCAPEIVEIVQLYLNFDPRYISFLPEESYLIQAGLASDPSHEIRFKQEPDGSGTLSLIHWGEDLRTDEEGTVAVLSFVLAQETPVTPRLFALINAPNETEPFVSTLESGKIYGDVEKILRFQVITSDLPPQQASPIPPQANTPPPVGEQSPPPRVEQTSVLAQGPAPDSSAEAPAGGLPPAQVEKAGQNVSVQVNQKSPLLTEDGLELFVPALNPPESQIPEGFGLKKMTIHGLEIPAIHNREKGTTFYYLTESQQTAFYSYDASSDRFKLENIDKYLVRKADIEQKTFARNERLTREGSLWSVILLSLVALAALAVLVYLALKFKRR